MFVKIVLLLWVALNLFVCFVFVFSCFVLNWCIVWMICLGYACCCFLGFVVVDYLVIVGLVCYIGCLDVYVWVLYVY